MTRLRLRSAKSSSESSEITGCREGGGGLGAGLCESATPEAPSSMRAASGRRKIVRNFRIAIPLAKVRGNDPVRVPAVSTPQVAGHAGGENPGPHNEVTLT